MNQVDALLAGVLERPGEPALLLVLADWLEERGDPASQARADLLRLQADWPAAADDPASLRRLEAKARRILKAHRGLVGDLQPLLRREPNRIAFPVLSAGAALPLFLLADLASPAAGSLLAGSSWGSKLLQSHFSIPTTLRLRRREGNRVEGDMEEDFSSMHGRGVRGTFHFRGVVVGRSHLAFVTYRTERAGIHPGLYELSLRGGWLTGTWWVPGYGLRGEMRLRRRKA